MPETTSKPFCRCLYEIDNKLPRTKFCLKTCGAGWEIIREKEREKEKEYEESKNKNKG